MDRRAVVGRVIRRLYFGKRPPSSEMAANASILGRLNGKGYGWDTLDQMVEGLALRRDRGELAGVGRNEPVSLRWVWSKDQQLNQVSVCLDAYYRDGERSGPREPGLTDIGTIIKRGVA